MSTSDNPRDEIHRHVSPRIERIIDIVGNDAWYGYRVEFRRIITLCIYSAKADALSGDLMYCLQEWGRLSQPELVEYYTWQIREKERAICWMCGKKDLSQLSPRRNRNHKLLLGPGGICAPTLDHDETSRKAIIDRIPLLWLTKADELIVQIRSELLSSAQSPRLEWEQELLPAHVSRQEE